MAYPLWLYDPVYLDHDFGLPEVGMRFKGCPASSYEILVQLMWTMLSISCPYEVSGARILPLPFVIFPKDWFLERKVREGPVDNDMAIVDPDSLSAVDSSKSPSQ